MRGSRGILAVTCAVLAAVAVTTGAVPAAAPDGGSRPLAAGPQPVTRPAPTPSPPPAPTPSPTARPHKPPVFVGWLRPDDPGDQVIRVYWEKVEAGTATPDELVDLGTMLFRRGYPKDAIRMFKRALEADDSLAEAWFRMGAVYHVQGQLTKARKAYRKCIKRFPGHGWCNFYLALCEEQLGNAAEALHYYRRAYRFSPSLMDPETNPAVLYSRIQAGARVPALHKRLVERQMPLGYLEKEKVEALRKRFEPTPTPAPEPAPPVPAKAGPRRNAAPPRATPAPREVPPAVPVPHATRPPVKAPRSGVKPPAPSASGVRRPAPIAPRGPVKVPALSPGGLKPLPPVRPAHGATPTPTPSR